MNERAVRRERGIIGTNASKFFYVTHNFYRLDFVNQRCGDNNYRN